jgi:hypothetical protein
VRQQLAHRDAGFAALPEGRPVAGQRLIERDPAGLDELHHRRGGRQHLGQRGEIEDRVRRHR